MKKLLYYLPPIAIWARLDRYNWQIQDKSIITCADGKETMEVTFVRDYTCARTVAEKPSD